METWLVTGANGFLGANAGYFLADRCHSIALTRSGLPANFASAVHADLTDISALGAAVRKAQPDVILHTAAMASHEACELDPHLAHQANALATQELALAAKEVGARFIYISTDAVFDGKSGNYGEADQPNPFSVYGRTKLEGETLALASNPGALVIRTNFFGWSPSHTRSILEFFVNALRSHQSVAGYTDFTVSSIYVSQLLQAIWGLNELAAKGIVNVAAGEPLSKHDFGLAVADTFGLDPGLVRAELSPSQTGVSRRRNLSLNTEHLQTLLREPAPDTRAGLLLAKADEAAVLGSLSA